MHIAAAEAARTAAVEAEHTAAAHIVPAEAARIAAVEAEHTAAPVEAAGEFAAAVRTV